MNERKSPFDKLAVRQAVNYAIDRSALVKLFGGQGTPTENIIPPGFGTRLQEHHFYPLRPRQGQGSSSGRLGRRGAWR